MAMLVDNAEGMRIAINNPILGFFAHLLWYLPILTVSAQRNIPVDIASVSPQYISPERGPNFPSYFFADRLAGQRTVRPDMPWTMIRHIGEVVADDDKLQTSFEAAHRVFFDRYAVQPWVSTALDTLQQSRPPGARLIGIHYRGTDKKSEAPRVAYEEMLAIIDRELTRTPDAHIFLATDEAHFLHACQLRYGNRLFFLRDSVRSTDGKAFHLHRRHDGFHLGRDAVLNCAMLSRCDLVIKTPSILSGWAKILNPALEMYLVRRPYSYCTWFPDRALPSYPGTIEAGDNAG
jgi:hypothetical protein